MKLGSGKHQPSPLCPRQVLQKRALYGTGFLGGHSEKDDLKRGRGKESTLPHTETPHPHTESLCSGPYPEKASAVFPFPGLAAPRPVSRGLDPWVSASQTSLELPLRRAARWLGRRHFLSLQLLQGSISLHSTFPLFPQDPLAGQ